MKVFSALTEFAAGTIRNECTADFLFNNIIMIIKGEMKANDDHGFNVSKKTNFN